MACASKYAFRFAPFTLAIAILICNCGCSDGDRANVTGRVVRTDGAPLVGATVIARSDETGKSVTGVTDANGSFQLGGAEPGDGVLPGEYGVIVMEYRGRPDNMKPPSIADKYADPASSGLMFSVQSGEDKVFDIAVDPS